MTRFDALRHARLRARIEDAQPIRPRSTRRLADEVSPRHSLLAFGSFWSSLTVILAFGPPAQDPPPPPALWEEALLWALMGAIMLVAFGTASRTRFGIHASTFGGAVLLVGAVACPLAGHAIGAWWYIQMAAGVVALSVPLLLARRA